MIKDYGVVGGLIGNFSNGAVTDSSWKCTRDLSDGWTLPTFDDSTWPDAIATKGQGDKIWGVLPTIARNAKWIWIGPYETVKPSVTVYSRKRLGKTYCHTSLLLVEVLYQYLTYLEHFIMCSVAIPYVRSSAHKYHYFTLCI